MIPAATPRRHLPARKTVAVSLLLGSLIAVAAATLTPTAASDQPISFWCLKCGERQAVDLLLNILLFVPVGAALGLYGVRFRRAVFLALFCTCAIEALQLMVVPGRYASLRDIFANFAGAMTGYLLCRDWLILVAPSHRAARILATAAAILWIVTQAFTAWAMVMTPPPEPWWAQLQPSHDRYPAVFTDRILAVSVGSIRIRNSDQLPSDDTQTMREQLLAGAPLRVVVTNVDTTRREAPIAIISGGPVHDVVWWAQEGRDGIFSVAVRGTLLGLRTPSVRIADVVPSARGDTLALAGAYRRGMYELRAENRHGVRHRELRASASWGWAFLLPFPLFAFGSTVIGLTALYLAAVWCVLGYWNARSVGAANAIIPVAGMLMAILLGLGVAPMMFALPIAHWSEWLAAIVGGAAGWSIARKNQTKARDSS